MNNDLRYYGNPMNWENTKGDLISREALKKEVSKVNGSYNEMSANQLGYDILRLIDNTPTVEGRMFYVQETVNTILNSHTGNTDIDKAFRNAARLIQNAIDGEPVNFEEIERERNDEI